jgi:hypothetical protein
MTLACLVLGNFLGGSTHKVGQVLISKAEAKFFVKPYNIKFHENSVLRYHMYTNGNAKSNFKRHLASM